MNSYTIFQLQVNDELINEMNRIGREEAATKYPAVKAYNEVMWSGGSEKYEPWMFRHYKMVGTIWADDMDECFAMGNGYPENDNTCATWVRPAHSMSVGDIILVNNDKTWYMVDRHGFGRIEVPPIFNGSNV